jgi:Sap, sulfolipid-1-addressing protein
VIIDLVFIGLAITLEPIPLTAFILILLSKGGTRKGAAFIFGWLLSLAVVVALTLLVTDNKPPKPSTAPSLAALAVKIAIGVVLVAIALRQRHRMGRPRPPRKTPKWQTGLDDMSPWYAVGLGPLTQPWGLVAAGVAVIVEAKIGSWQSYVALVAFCLIATGLYLVLEVLVVRRPAQAGAFLGKIRSWMDSHRDHIIIVVSLALGLWLIGKGLYQVVT